MPTYLSTLYPTHPSLLSSYGIIVGVCGSVSVLLGGALTTLFWSRTKLLPLYLTAIGGMVSSLFVLLMINSKAIARGNEDKGVKVLWGSMSLAYLTAEMWLGAMNMLIALLLPPRYKTFGLAVWSAIQVLIYSSGPEVVGLSQRWVKIGYEEYERGTRVALGAIIVVGYWAAGLGFLGSVRKVRRDLKGEVVVEKAWRRRKVGFAVGGFVVVGLVIGLFVSSIYYGARGEDAIYD
ncbi:MAG: hypothetical protein Q9222_005223 [Ikaeria aurantiellina]